MSTSKKLENEYNHCIYKMMHTLSKRCVKAIIGESVDHQKFAALIGKQFGILSKLEEERYIQFKFSESLQELTELLGLQEENYDIIQNNQQKQKRLEVSKKNLYPVKNISKSIDQKVTKVEVLHPEPQHREYKEIRDSFNFNFKEIKEINQNIQQNSFFFQRRAIKTENGYQKTLEQKEREFLERFKQRLEDH